MGMETSLVEPMSETTIPDVTFDSLYREHHPYILAYFLRRFDRETAIDCAADVFTIAWRRLHEVPTGEQTIRWLYGVSRNVSRNQQRSQRRLGRLRARLLGQSAPSPVQPEAKVVDAVDVELVDLAMSHLRFEDRELLHLVTWEELSRADVAEILGCSRHAVDQRIQRAVARLRREYNRASRREGTRR